MEGLPKCLLCLELADPKSAWESTWSANIAESMEKLIELEVFPSAFFEMGDYCHSCKELTRDVDFVTRSISTLGKRLDKYRTRIAQMLLENLEEWTNFQDNRSVAIDRQRTSPTNETTIPIIKRESHVILMKTVESDSDTPGSDEDVKELVDGACQSDFRLLQDASNPVEDEVEPQIRQVATRVLTTGPVAKNRRGQSNLHCSYPDCGMEFQSLTALETHNRLHVGWKPFKCTNEGCSAAYTQKHKLKEHLGKRRCQNLRNDLPTEIPATSGDFRCDFAGCGKEFPNITGLETHLAIHIGWRQFKCSHEGCLAAFLHRHHLVRHVRNLHESSNDFTSPTPCPVPLDNQRPGELEDDGIHPEAENQDEFQVDSSSLRRSRRTRKKLIVVCDADSDEEVSMDWDPEFEPSSTSEDEVESVVIASRATARSVSGTQLGLTSQSESEFLRKRTTGPEQLELKKAANGDEIISKGVLKLAANLFCSTDEINQDVLPCIETNGEVQTWQSVGISDDDSPPDTLEDTVFHLLRQRMKDAEEEFSFGCPSIINCPRRFSNTHHLRIHIHRVHGDFVWPFHCDICSRSCLSEEELNVHVSRSHGSDNFPHVCKYPSCNSKFRRVRDLEKHGRLHNIRPEDELTVCGMQLSLVPKLKLANGERFGNMKRCSEAGCKYKTLYLKHLDAHRRKVHQEEAKPYHCDQCDAKLKTKESYRAHQNSVHGKLAGVVCQYCGYRTAFPFKLTAHVRNKHRDVAEEFRCSVCTHAYFTSEDCKSHEELHARLKTFNCVLSCENRSHATREELIQHVQNVHEGVKRSVCEVCGFTSIGTHHSSHMKIHMHVHTRVKSWKCKYCNRTFLNGSELYTHTQIHHAEEVKAKYTCADCQEQFKVYQYYYRHRRNKHGNPIPPFKRKRKVESSEGEDDESMGI